MKFSWVTVTEKSMDKEHQCIVKDERNKERVNQEIDFPSINKEFAAINSTEASLHDENDPLQLQLMNTSAYYTYLLLLLKSLMYSIVTAICLLGRSVFDGNGKSS
uniref:Uncharacterized protein n=1 Tax=Canis lupus familiaris TaxID=9615 RepID=A0A8I3S4Z1_CANLF